MTLDSGRGFVLRTTTQNQTAAGPDE
jgi:hypothetical protein